MKVLFVNRTTANSVPGGDTVQMNFTAKHLQELGVEVDFIKQNVPINYKEYDLIHFFNITRPTDILVHTQKTKIPFVVSTIFVDYAFYKNSSSNNKMKWLTKLFGTDGIEYVKTLAKHFLKNEKVQYLPYFWKGQKRSIKKILKDASFILPNSENEYKRVIDSYKTKVPYKIIPNGVDFEKFTINAEIKRKQKQVLCVGQIEPRKNQLNLIKAINSSDYSLKIIGNSAPNHTGYYEECKQVAKENVSFLSQISQEELAIHYQESEIHILPSWFETTGLVSLEAAYLGCKIVVSPMGDTKDYFRDFAQYCEPDSVNSIKEAINEAHRMEYSTELKNLVITDYNWTNAAKLTKEAYFEILNLDQ